MTWAGFISGQKQNPSCSRPQTLSSESRICSRVGRKQVDPLFLPLCRRRRPQPPPRHFLCSPLSPLHLSHFPGLVPLEGNFTRRAIRDDPDMEEEVGSEGAIQERILEAIRARVRDFREQADSITLENVRRIIEKDLGMESFTLDGHKRFIKQSLEKCLDAAEDEAISGDSAENSSMKPEVEENKEQRDHDPMHDKKYDEISTIVNGTHDSPNTKTKTDLNEATIKRAIKKRAAYLRKNSEKLSLVEVRRILEGDLDVEKNALDPYKKFISQQLDEVFQTPEIKKKPISVRKVKGSKKVNRSDESGHSSSSDVSRSEDEETDEPKGKPKKRGSRNARREKVVKKQRKSTEDDDRSLEDDESHSSDEEAVKHKKQTPALTYGKRVEHLKSIIKSCGLGVPPTVYKRVKQAPESKREFHLIKELEDMLRKEGLSTNPSEKEIKAVKRKKERAKELEGIDLSNIVSSTRRRSAFIFSVPPKPEIPIESDEDEEEKESAVEEQNEEADDEVGNEDEDGEEQESDEESNDSEEEVEDEDEESD